MNIALIGYGKMGRMIERIATERGHKVVCRIDKENQNEFSSDAFKSADVAIEFSTPATAVDNIRHAWDAGVPVVCGTTGWKDRLPILQAELQTNSQALLWSSNFSVGVNLFFTLNKRLAELMKSHTDYQVSMTEIHHVHKLDAPSGTAVTLAEDIGMDKGVIHSVREGEVPGTHIVRYDSLVDSISIIHEAKNREGFALGAVIAAEYMQGKKGFYTMSDVMKL